MNTGDTERRAGDHTAPFSSKGLPFLRLLVFYVALIGVGVYLAYAFPVVRDAWANPQIGAPGADPSNPFAPTENPTLSGSYWERSVSTALIALGALAVSLPVAWVYTYTRRLRFDPSLVQSVVILPIVVAGIVAVVQHSIALAFSLAGIVAAVRFRNTLKDPKDAVYIFLALGIGIAAGVRALDIALVLSLLFNFAVLVLWRFNLGSIYSHRTGTDLLSVGDEELLIAQTARQRSALRWRLTRELNGMKADGILLVHTQEPEAAARALEMAASQMADEWKIVDNLRRRGNVATVAALLKFDKKKGDALELLSDLEERWSSEIEAAEYIPLPAQEETSNEKRVTKNEQRETTKPPGTE